MGSIINKMKRVFKEPESIIVWIGKRSSIVPDSFYLRCAYKHYIGKTLNLDNTTTFNEKLQWLKLHDRKDIYKIMVDKYEAKKYVASIIGDEYIIPTLGVWDSVEEIDFTSLPAQFVLKCTHDSGGVIICKDKNKFDFESAKRKLKHNLKKNFYLGGREWPYKGIKPRIIAEEYMEDKSTGELRDYKFFTFNSSAKALFSASDRQNEYEDTKFVFSDLDFKHLDVRNGHPFATKENKKPETFEQMRKAAEILSKGIPNLRVDFYEVSSRMYFGELTFYQNSGLVPIEPPEWDKTLGDWLVLPDDVGGVLIRGNGYCFWLHQEEYRGLTDYKVHCFNGKPLVILVCKNRFSMEGMEEDFFSANWEHLSVSRPNHLNSSVEEKKPAMLDKMLEISKELSKECPFLRVDFYLSNSKLYVGELTFYPASGFEAFVPNEYDITLGNMLDVRNTI